MNSKTRTGLEILEAALLLGILGDALLRATPWGLNLLLWVGALVAAMVALTLRRRREFWTTENLSLHAALIVFAGLFVWRDSLMLQVLDVLILLAILSILTLPALKIQTHAAGFLHYCLGAIYGGLNAMFAPFLLVLGDVEWKTIPRRSGWAKHLIPVLRGLAIAAPILLVFGALFMAADAVFEGIVKNTFNLKPDVVVGHVVLFGFLAWITAGYLRGAFLGSLEISGGNIVANQTNKGASEAADSIQTLGLNEKSAVQSVIDEANGAPAENKTQTESTAESAAKNAETKSSLTDYFTLGAVEIGIVLGLINLLFLGFVAVQVRYFFGGMDLVQSTPDFKLAEYARRGFFELCWVAGLTLPILLTVHWLLRKDNATNEKLFRVLAAINIALLFVIMFSAVQRMLLYTGNLGYGLTEMRLYPTAFMLWLALVFLWFGLTVLRGQTKLFAWGALWTALLVVAGLHVLNPDDLIVRQNVRLMQQGRSFDAYYMKNLSADAIPALAENLPAMSPGDQCAVKVEFLTRLIDEGATDFRTFNLSRWQAKQALAPDQVGLNIIGCPKSTWRGESQHYVEGELPRSRRGSDFEDF